MNNTARKDAASLFGILLVVAVMFSVFVAYKSIWTVAQSQVTNNVNAIVSVPNACYAIVTANSLNFGIVSPSTTTGIQTVTISDTVGNVDSFPYLAGTNWGYDNGAGASNFYVTNTMYENGIAGVIGAGYTALTTVSTNTYALVKPSATTVSNVITFEVTIPAQQAVATYNQIIFVVETC